MKKNYTSLPSNYAICQHCDCKMANSCLHQLAYQQLLQSETYLHLINPEKCSKDEHCQFYRDNKPVLYAKGFTNFQKRMYPEQYQDFMRILIRKFGRNPYFERRRGARLLPPKEQKTILDALHEVGITEEITFDNYEESINWYD